MKEILNLLFEHKKLSQEQAKEVLINISQNKYNTSEIASFISVYLMRNISVEELAGFKDALLELCVSVDFSAYNTVDIVGTGGDSKNTFNISTLSSLVVAGAGYKVAKHGNYGVSSVSGSSNVLEKMGYTFTNDQSVLTKQMENAGMCFLHAPLFHPALKSVGPIRRELGVKTFFNMLGPLVNPSRPQNNCIGVFSLKLARIYQYLFQATSTNYVILHSIDGYDEVSLTDKVKLITNTEEKLVDVAYFGMAKYAQHDLHGGDTVEEAANIFSKILNGDGTQAQKDVIYCNAGLAINACQPNKSISECISEAKESLDSGKAKQVLAKLISI